VEVGCGREAAGDFEADQSMRRELKSPALGGVFVVNGRCRDATDLVVREVICCVRQSLGPVNRGCCGWHAKALNAERWVHERRPSGETRDGFDELYPRTRGVPLNATRRLWLQALRVSLLIGVRRSTLVSSGCAG
jgi:hypothetical protein